MTEEERYKWSCFFRKTAAQFMLHMAHNDLRGMSPNDIATKIVSDIMNNAFEFGLTSEEDGYMIAAGMAADIHKEEQELEHNRL